MLKELLLLKEGQMKRAIEDLIEYAVNHAPIGTASYDMALKIIARFAKQNDDDSVVVGIPNDELVELIKPFFSKADHVDHIKEDVSDSEFPKVIAKADEFRVELDEDDQVHLLDGADKVTVSMPFVIWKQLTR